MSDTNGTASRRPWIMNAFVMNAPGHLAPGEKIVRLVMSSSVLTISKASGVTPIRATLPLIIG